MLAGRLFNQQVISTQNFSTTFTTSHNKCSYLVLFRIPTCKRLKGFDAVTVTHICPLHNQLADCLRRVYFWFYFQPEFQMTQIISTNTASSGSSGIGMSSTATPATSGFDELIDSESASMCTQELHKINHIVDTNTELLASALSRFVTRTSISCFRPYSFRL